MVFESQKLSVLVADPQHTKVNIHPDSINDTQAKSPKMYAPDKDFPKDAVMESIMGQVLLLPFYK